jgi:hypothetical protein
MVGERCSCAILDRTTPPSVPKIPLSLLVPFDTTIPPVSPLFPLDTNNRRYPLPSVPIVTSPVPFREHSLIPPCSSPSNPSPDLRNKRAAIPATRLSSRGTTLLHMNAKYDFILRMSERRHLSAADRVANVAERREKRGRPPSCSGQAEGRPCKSKRTPRAQTKSRCGGHAHQAS